MEDPALTASVISRGALALAALVAACGGERPAPEAGAAVPPPLARADTATIAVALELPAHLYVEHDAVVAARSGGILDSLHVDIGDVVAAGDLLARIEDVDQVLEVERARAALEQAERTVARLRTLQERNGATAVELEAAELEARAASVARRQAERALELTRIVAPFGGRVTARYVRPRWLVAAGDTLFRVAATGPLLARVRVPEGAAATLRAGARVEVRLPGERPATATVALLAPAIDPGSGTREVILRLGAAEAAVPGGAVTVRIGRTSRLAVVVPREAVSDDGYALVDAGGRLVLRALALGADLGDGRIEVLSGVQAGDRLTRPER